MQKSVLDRLNHIVVGLASIGLFLSIPARAATILNVTAFGVVGNGIHDDATVLQAAANAVPPSGAELLFPSGLTCLISRTIYLKSNTHVEGNGSTILAASNFVKDPKYGNALVTNIDYCYPPPEPITYRDSNIAVNNLVFDYGPYGYGNGANHALRFASATDCSVTNCTFQCRGANDAVAGIAVRNMLVMGNKAYDWDNCGYDFWTGLSGVKLYNNYGSTKYSTGQMVNWNSYRESGSPCEVCSGFDMQGNTLICTGEHAIPVNITPLTRGGANKDITLFGNKLVNSWIAIAGDTSNVDIENNTISNVIGGASAFYSGANGDIGGTPNNVVFAWNTIDNPHTVPGNDAVVRVESNNSYIDYNTITGDSYTAVAYATTDPWSGGAFAVPVVGNTVSALHGPVVFVDKLNPRPTPQPAFSNPSFETPVLPALPGCAYGPAGADWIFKGVRLNSSGLATNRSALGSIVSPNGAQAAFIKGKGSLAQSLSFPVTGRYFIAFQGAQRIGCLRSSVKVYIDGLTIGGPMTAPGARFSLLKTQPFNATAGMHTIKFEGTGNKDKAAAIFLDEMTIYRAL